MARVIEPDDIDFNRYMGETEPQMRVKPASSWIDEVVAQMALAEQGDPNPALPWPKTWGDFRFRRGEVTLWAGASQSGKSLLTGQVSTSLCSQGQKVCVASFEMKPHKTIDRMLRQCFPFNIPAPRDARLWGNWSDDRMWLYDQQGRVLLPRLVAVIRYCAEELGIGHFFIDNLAKCVASEKESDDQKEFIEVITTLAQDLNMHLHVVHHIRKGENEDDVPDKWSVKGTTALTDLVDNVLMFWANKRKRHEADEGITDRAAEPDAMLICEKQRNGPFNGKWKLWQHRQSLQYIEDGIIQPMNLLEWPHSTDFSAVKLAGAA